MGRKGKIKIKMKILSRDDIRTVINNKLYLGRLLALDSVDWSFIVTNTTREHLMVCTKVGRTIQL